MSKLFYIQFLFIYILLFHFVTNEEKFYIKYQEKKWEFDLYNNTGGGSSLYQLLKKNNNIYNVDMIIQNSNEFMKSTNSYVEFSYNSGGSIPKRGNIFFSFSGFYICLIDQTSGFSDSEIFGQVIQSDNFANYFLNLNPRPAEMEIQFILEEVFEKPKNLKIMERMKILKRTIEMKPHHFWNIIGWKSLESFKSFLKLKKGKLLNLFNN